MLTVQSLIDELGLDLAAGTQAAEAPAVVERPRTREESHEFRAGGQDDAVEEPAATGRHASPLPSTTDQTWRGFTSPTA